jgi:hypothetical protein
MDGPAEGATDIEHLHSARLYGHAAVWAARPRRSPGPLSGRELVNCDAEMPRSAALVQEGEASPLNVSPQAGAGRSIFGGKTRRVAPLLAAGENQPTADQRFVLAGEVAADHKFASPDWPNGSAAALWAFGLGYRG